MVDWWCYHQADLQESLCELRDHDICLLGVALHELQPGCKLGSLHDKDECFKYYVGCVAGYEEPPEFTALADTLKGAKLARAKALRAIVPT